MPTDASAGFVRDVHDAIPGRPPGTSSGMIPPIYIGDTQIEELLEQAQSLAIVRGAEESIRRADAAITGLWPLGLERFLLRRRLPQINFSEVDLQSDVALSIRYRDTERFHHLLRRTPSEVAVWELWKQLDAANITQVTIGDISTLLGGERKLRTAKATTSAFSSGHRIEFLQPEDVPSRWEALLQRVGAGSPSFSPLLHAVSIYFEALLIHPFADGNGRLARLLFQGSLRQSMGIKRPFSR